MSHSNEQLFFGADGAPAAACMQHAMRFHSRQCSTCFAPCWYRCTWQMSVTAVPHEPWRPNSCTCIFETTVSHNGHRRVACVHVCCVHACLVSHESKHCVCIQIGRAAPLRSSQINKGQLALGHVLSLQVGGLNDHGHDQVGARRLAVHLHTRTQGQHMVRAILTCAVLCKYCAYIISSKWQVMRTCLWVLVAGSAVQF